MTTIIAKLEIHERDIDDAIKNLTDLRTDHITRTKCKEPDRCDDLKHLRWLIMQLEEGQKEIANLTIDCCEVMAKKRMEGD